MADVAEVPLHLQHRPCRSAAGIRRASVAFLQRYQWHKCNWHFVTCRARLTRRKIAALRRKLAARYGCAALCDWRADIARDAMPAEQFMGNKIFLTLASRHNAQRLRRARACDCVRYAHCARLIAARRALFLRVLRGVVSLSGVVRSV